PAYRSRHARHRSTAAKAVALQHQYLQALTGCRVSGGHTGRPAPHNQHVCVQAPGRALIMNGDLRRDSIRLHSDITSQSWFAAARVQWTGTPSLNPARRPATPETATPT